LVKKHLPIYLKRYILILLVKKKKLELIEQLKPFINSAGDAVIIVPLIKDYLDVSVKNDDLLIKMAGIVQRAMNSSAGEDSMLISDAEKEMLFESIQSIR
jgi:hypothetical protein